MTRLVDRFSRLITYVLFLTNSLNRGGQPAFQKVYNEIMQLIDEMEKGMGANSDDYINARFAVFAWIDEMVMNSNWQEKNAWLKETLQRKYYQTSDAGELFFDRLNQIGIHQNQVREVYLVCLALGFGGRYCNPDDKYLLDQLKVSNLRVLTGSSLGVPTMDQAGLFPEAKHVNVNEDILAEESRRFSLSTITVAVMPVLLLVTFFIVYSFILENAGREIIDLMVQK